ncbi:hypothetical protein [Hoeflea alexandrii]|uniref:hypothetical protein n=1 Tax=Hoeflea alexandrii TaxID=288436 RepID=UPI0022AF4ED3|nr:hypothetical protein [Hoeflea alexandrii]MCZ4288201.1 hypothetical protein [Hoeflea alexandrii]
MIAIGHFRLESATVAGKNAGMQIRRALFMCLLTFALAATGPFARGLSGQAAALSQAVETNRPRTAISVHTGAAPFTHCHRGAVAWSICSSDLGYVRRSLQVGPASTGEAFVGIFPGTTDDLWSSRLFRPPRLS